jgi:hypothetical protein
MEAMFALLFVAASKAKPRTEKWPDRNHGSFARREPIPSAGEI